PAPPGAARCGWGRATGRSLRPCRACRSPPSHQSRPAKDEALTPAITHHASPPHHGDRPPLPRLQRRPAPLPEPCRAAAASQAEVSCSEDRGLEVDVRMGEVESVESTRDRGIAVTVYFGKRRGSASTADLREESVAATVAQACAIARHTEDDAAAGLAEAELM